MIHLTETGFHAGRRLCLSSDEGRSVHAAYAPLNNEDFRNKCCQDCLKTYALEAYEEGDEMPDWVLSIRSGTQCA